MTTNISAENEIAIYARITNFSGLEKATRIIEQEQYEIKSGIKGKIRVRKETFQQVDTYTLTTKVSSPSNSSVSNTEFTISIDREFFDSFRQIANKGMKKSRYMFPISQLIIDNRPLKNLPETYFEVDVFTRPDGLKFSWCKIDLELDNILRSISKKLDDEFKLKIIARISDLSFKPVEMFIGDQATEEQNKLLDVLFKEVFTIKC